MGALALCSAFAASAQGWPAKPVRIVVSSTAGGGSDFVGRLLAQKLTETLGQQFIVDNRPGGGGMLGIEFGMKSAPDGHTFNLITPSYAINPALYAVKFDPASDFTPVIKVASGPLIAVVHPSVPAKSPRELIALARARPGQITYGTSGQGSIVHLANAQFLHMAGVNMVHVPYKGGAPALTDLIAGQVQLVFATPQTSLPQVKAGRVRALGVTTAARLPAEPSIPPIGEAVPGYDVANWHALIGPRGVARAVVDRLNAETMKIIRDKDMEERMRTDGVGPAGGTPEELQAQVHRELGMWRAVVQAAGIKIQ
jgi:tripartite-type tricarboxylate transporter receptor subunit TctC